MKIEETKEGSVTVLALEGAIDIDNCRTLREKLNGLLDTGRYVALLDFSKVVFISSAVLGVLIRSAQRFEDAGGKLALCSLDDNVRSVFQVAGLEKFFVIHSNAKEALEDMS